MHSALHHPPRPTLPRLSLTASALTLILALTPGAARARDAVFAPADAAARLIGPGAPDADAVRAVVERDGFWAGAPIGAGACARCHPDVAAQWSASAHRFASFNNPYYRVAFDAFRLERGNPASRFCADCHDPVMVAAGRIDGPAATPPNAPMDVSTREAQAGIGCRVCHGIVETPDPRGNADYHVAVGPLGLEPGPRRTHAQRMAPAPLRTAELCRTCHTVGLTEEVTADIWQRGQDEYTAWHDSTAPNRGVSAVWRPPAADSTGAPRAPVRCQDCHMPEVAASADEKGARDGRVRSHWFLGANSALPHLRGDAAHEERTRVFLRDAVSVMLATSTPGVLDVVLRNRKAAHRFPGGVQDANEVWLEVEARDAAGRPIGRSGTLDGGRRGPEAALIRVQPIDGEGKPITRRAAQHTRAIGYDHALPPHEPRAFRYALPEGTTWARARLRYRQFDADYLAFACAAVPATAARARCLDAPVIEVAEAQASIVDGAVPPLEAWMDLVDHGLALADGLAEHVDAAIPSIERARALAPDRAEPVLALARVHLRSGRTDALLDLLARGPAATHPAADWLRLQAALNAYRLPAAREAAEHLAVRFPDDRRALGLLARTRGLTGDPAGALDAADRLLARFPEDEEALRQRLLALRDLAARPTPIGAPIDPETIAEAEAAWLRHRRRLARDQHLRQLDPGVAAEVVPLRIRPLPPPG